MTLYLKYRPQKLEDLDLADVREQLINIIKSGNFPHALLFSGPRGVGKTSAARIFAKVINCEAPFDFAQGLRPCNECDQCLSITKGSNIDVIEMDAASNRGIDDIRALRENISLAPARAKKKIYIIDEVHMLTTEAANAFLKTLEEPPEHVMFILATTNPEKLPETIHSRLVNVVFRKASVPEVERQLKRVIDGEKMKIEEGVVGLIAKACEGSFRDAAKLLESLSANFESVTLQNANEFLFQSEVLQVDNLLNLLEKRDAKLSLGEVERVAAAGGAMKNYIDRLLEKLHQKLLVNPTSETIQLIELLAEAKNQLSTALISQLPLELAICKWCMKKISVVQQIEETKVVEIEKAETTVEKVEIKDAMDTQSWQRILVTVKEKNASIEALLRAAKPMSFDGKTLTLGVYYQFHKERLEVLENRKTLEDVLQVILGNPVRVSCTLTQKPPQVKAQGSEALHDAKDQDIIKAAKEIFGS